MTLAPLQKFASDPPMDITVLFVLAELIIRNGFLADSWMLIMSGALGTLKPKSVDVCCRW
jgi:hypothetical protein